MHESVMTWFREWFDTCYNMRVLEVGSRNINGSVRPLVESTKPLEYIGIDIEPGPGVDRVLNAIYLTDTFPAWFDVVICTETLEHARDYLTVIAQMKAVLKPGGVLYLTTRSPGFPLHEYPGDYWRFTKAQILTLFKNMQIESCEDDPQTPGVFLKARKPL